MATKKSEAQMRYDKANTRFYGVKLNLRTDADIVAYLDAQPNLQACIKQALRDHIAAHPTPTNHFAEKEASTMTVINQSGKGIDFNAALSLMDDDIREALHAEGYDTEQAFFSAYEQAHAEKYGAPWELSKENPVW